MLTANAISPAESRTVADSRDELRQTAIAKDLPVRYLCFLAVPADCGQGLPPDLAEQTTSLRPALTKLFSSEPP